MQNVAERTEPGFTVRVSGAGSIAFLVVGVISVIGGGLVAAVARPLGWTHGAWAAAYLVLVTGVAQLVLGIGQGLLARHRVGGPLVAAELIALNVGSATVLIATILGAPAIVDIGGALILIALVLLLVGVRTAAVSAVAVIYRLVVVLLILSIPIGLVLAAIDAAQA